MKTRYIILEFIKDYFEKHCYAPSYKEMQEGVGLSKGTIHGHIKRLFEEGLLENDFDDDFAKPRAFRPAGYVCVKKEDA